MQVATIGLDLAKHGFQVHGVDAAGDVVVTRLKRSEVTAFFAAIQPCLEACSTSHYWAREIGRFAPSLPPRSAPRQEPLMPERAAA